VGRGLDASSPRTQPPLSDLWASGFGSHSWLYDIQPCTELNTRAVKLCSNEIKHSVLGYTASCKQVCVEPPPSALNVTIPAFAAKRQRNFSTAPAARSQGAQQQTRQPPSIDRTDTDGRTNGRPTVIETLLHILCRLSQYVNIKVDTNDVVKK